VKNVISAILLLVAFPMFTGGGFEITGMMGPPSLPWGIGLSLGALVSVLLAGLLASPKRERVGFFRGVAFTYFFLGSAGVPVYFAALLYKVFAHVELLDSDQLTWGLVQSTSALACLLFSAKAWNLFRGRAEDS
jgi:hypothetical protein